MRLIRQKNNAHYTKEFSFNITQLGDCLKKKFLCIEFALLHGSACTGVVLPGSDLDIAIYCSEPPTLTLFSDIQKVVNDLVPGVECDIGILNRAELVYQFEALKGRLLFVRDEEIYVSFYSLTCRAYETQMYAYERQQKYRIDALKT